MRTRPLLLGSALFLVALLPGCGGGGGEGHSSKLETLSGRLVAPDGSPLSGAKLELQGAAATIDLNRLSLLPSAGILHSGSYPLRIEEPAGFGTLQVPVQVAAGTTDVELPAPITIPDLVSFPAGSTTISLDSHGASLDAVALTGPLGDLAASGPQGTTVQIGDGGTSSSVALALAPLAADELSPQPPADRVIVSAAALAPAEARFTTPDGAGLDLLLPNVEQLPLGTPVELLQFDNDAMAWVSRSAGLDPAPSVVELAGGTRAISASGLVRSGGIWIAALDLDGQCATTLAGRVVDAAGNGLAGIAVQTSTGQTEISDAIGNFELRDVPAYELSSGSCLPRDVQVLLSAPVSQGGSSAPPITVLSSQIQAGSTTELGDVQADVAAVGCVAGLLLSAGPDPVQPVMIQGPTPASAQAASDGSFFACGLEPGSYTASFTYPGDATATLASFDVQQGKITKIELERILGGGSSTLEVVLLERSVGTPETTRPVDGAILMLRGTDSVSASGLMATTDAAGVALFQGVDGPYEITAIAEDLLSSGLVLRRATTAIGVDSIDGSTTLLLDLDGNPLAHESALDARLSGGLANLPAGCTATVHVTGRDTLGELPAFEQVLAAPFGAYALDVPSGQVLDVTVTLDCDAGLPGAERAGLRLALPALGIGEQRLLDLDVTSGDFFDLDATTPASIAAAETQAATISTVRLHLDGPASGARLAPELLATGPGLPSSVGLPDLGTSVLSGLGKRVALIVSSDSPFATIRQSQTEVLQLGETTPAALAFELLAVPTLNAPASSSTPTGLTFALGAAPLGTGEGGFDRLTLEGFGFQFEGGPENAIVCWTLVLPAGTSSVSLPPAAASILQPTNYEGRLTLERFADSEFSASDLNAPDAATRLANARATAARARTSTTIRDLVILP